MKIDLSKIPEKKIIGAGMFGTAYLVNINGIDYVAKIQKIQPHERKKSFKYNIWRELDFFEYINKLSNDQSRFFMKLLGYEFTENCQHIQKRQGVVLSPKFKQLLEKIDRSNLCIEYVMEYKGEVYSRFIRNNKLSNKQIYSFILQMYALCTIMKYGGYLHNDLHMANVAVIKTKDKYIMFKNMKIPTFGYQLSVIDYGEVINNKYPHNKICFKINPDELFFYEFRYGILGLMNTFSRHINGCEKRKKKMPWDKNPNLISDYLNEILTKHPNFWKETKTKIINVFPKTEKFIKIFEQSKNIMNCYNKKDDHIVWNMIDIYYNLFNLYYPREHAKYYNWCTVEKFTLDAPLVEKILFSTSQKQICDLIMSKLKKK
jgi:hypothetical protein